MALGFLKIPFESIVVAYNDEVLPVKLTGKKMLPIFEFEESDIQNESLDIIKRLDKNNSLSMNLIGGNKFIELETLLNKLGSDVHSLCMPYWIWTPEFDETSRSYFQSKKETKRGPFKNLIHNKDEFINSLNKNLDDLEKDLDHFYKSEKLTILDIMLASHLWGMYIFPEFQFSPKVHDYLQRVRATCHFDYHQDFWR